MSPLRIEALNETSLLASKTPGEPLLPIGKKGVIFPLSEGEDVKGLDSNDTSAHFATPQFLEENGSAVEVSASSQVPGGYADGGPLITPGMSIEKSGLRITSLEVDMDSPLQKEMAKVRFHNSAASSRQHISALSRLLRSTRR